MKNPSDDANFRMHGRWTRTKMMQTGVCLEQIHTSNPWKIIGGGIITKLLDQHSPDGRVPLDPSTYPLGVK